jgi:hypothetical protein
MTKRFFVKAATQVQKAAGYIISVRFEPLLVSNLALMGFEYSSYLL